MSNKKKREQQHDNEQQNNSLPQKQNIEDLSLQSLEEVLKQAENKNDEIKGENQKKITYIHNNIVKELKKWEKFLLDHSAGLLCSELYVENSKYLTTVDNIYNRYSKPQPEEKSVTVEEKSVYYIDKLRSSYYFYHSTVVNIINKHAAGEEQSHSCLNKITNFFIRLFSWFLCLINQSKIEQNIQNKNAQSYDALLKKVGVFKPQLLTYESFYSLRDNMEQQDKTTHANQSSSDLHKENNINIGIFKRIGKKIRGAFTNTPTNAPVNAPSIGSDHLSYNPYQH